MAKPVPSIITNGPQAAVFRLWAPPRHQLDREGEAYKAIYKQRTATERINAQATECPKLRNFKAIARHNTLLYVLLNLKALQRVRDKKTTLAAEAVMT